MLEFSQYGLAVCVGIALSACCGFRVFLPLLVSSIAMKFGWMPVEASAHWMGSWTAMLAFGVASVLEIGAYYIPVVDNILDAIASPLAVGAGALVATSLFPITDWDPMLRWGLGLVAGGGMAGVIHLGTGALRLLSTKTTAGAGNLVLATGEHLVAGVGAVLSLLIPVMIALLAVILVIFIIFKLIVRINR